MEINNSKKKYIREFKNVVKEIARNNQRNIIQTNTSEELEFDKKISQYGILGKNLKNLSFEQKKKFGEFIDKEISIKKKISDNYNTEYFVEQERVALQRKLKYEVLIEIETLTRIANRWTEEDLKNEIEDHIDIQETYRTVIIGNEDNFVSKDKHENYIRDFENKRNAIRQRIEDVKNGNKQKS